MFLKIDGIEGESADHKHKGEIDILSYSMGATQTGTMASGGGGGAGKVSLQDIHFTTNLSKASPKIMEACTTGQHLKKAVLVQRKAGGKQEEYLKITLSDALVSSYQIGGSHHGDHTPVDQFSLNFAKIEVEYKEQKADGSVSGVVKGGWDVKANKKI
jgi:type VI secretion system secreted protein Hcp